MPPGIISSRWYFAHDILMTEHRLRIVFLISSLGTGGTERQLVTLAKALAGRGWRVTVLVYYPGGAFEPELKQTDVELISLDKGSRWDIVGFPLRLMRVLRALRPDILHGYLPTANLWSLFMRPWLRRVRVVWGVRSSNMDLTRYERMTGVLYWLEARLSRFADMVICNSRAGMELAAFNKFPVARLRVVPNGIDTVRFCPDMVIRKKMRAEWGLGDDERLIGIVGRFDPMKDHRTFLEAAALIAVQASKVCFVVVGDRPRAYAEELVALARRLGISQYMIWAKTRKDMETVYNALDISVSSSSFGEGFPNVVGEAMACGALCAVTDVGDSAWIVQDTGQVVPPRDPRSLASAVLSLLGESASSRRARSMAARLRIVSEFSVETLGERTDTLLKGLACLG